MASGELHISLVQPDIIWQDAGKNLVKISHLLKGITEQTDIIILPEMFSTGFCTDPALYAESMDGETVAWMRKTAESMHSAVAGSLIIREGDRFFNRLVVADYQDKIEWYDKRHLFRMAGEDVSFTPGSKPLIANIGDWRISFQICYDLRFPVWSRNRQNYDLLVYVSSWPASRSDVWNTLLRARAMENQCYVAGVNRIGTDGNDIAYIGESMIIDPKGNVTAALIPSAEGILSAAISLHELNTFRAKFPVWKDWDDWVWV